ncbi:Katanin p60 ATPase-containing subunit A1 [Apostasia shenzhenica]|uniref:Katanin p60 ATPase-containing subunit A1 n=1 Tax=Apostasia shenzhenica TaxID=1088818 RepID=A0A2I0AY47_9ASPA|nr:Katanin p60 ATPase-containing subunit A1 [Apostasia shenzhenica]
MYARNLKCRGRSLSFFISRSSYEPQSCRRISSTCNSIWRAHFGESSSTGSFTGRFFSVFFPSCSSVGTCRKHRIPLTCGSHRFYSSESDGSNASGGKQIPIKDATKLGEEKSSKEDVLSDLNHNDQHARLGEHEQQEWLKSEKLSIDSKKNESPFLTRRQRFKNEFLRRVVPWEKIAVSWKTFPYYINEHTKNLLVECAASHLRHRNFTSAYGSRLSSSTGRILLQGASGTELYRERLVRALARDLQVPLLMLDGSVLAPFNFGEECASGSESEDGNVDSGEECSSDSEVEEENEASNEEEWGSSSEAKSGESDDEDGIEMEASAEALKKLVPCSLEEFAKNISGEVESTLKSSESNVASSPEDSKRPLRKGDRVKYVGASMQIEAEKEEYYHRFKLGKTHPSYGSTDTFTSFSARPLLNGQRGEVYEVKDNYVAVILDNAVSKTDESNKGLDEKPSIYWFDIQDIVHDLDIEAEDWYIAIEALFEVLPSLQPLIVYFPDSFKWLLRAVPKSSHKEFMHKLEQMLEQLSEPVVLICGRNILETGGSKEKEKLTMIVPQFRIGRLPLPLKQLTEGLRATKPTKGHDTSKLFTNSVVIHLPKEVEQLRIFNKQIEEDRKIIMSRTNLIELHKVLEENDLSCMELLHVKSDGVTLTKQKTEKIVGWARNHYLSSIILPSIQNNRLLIPRQSLEVAISRLREQELVSRKPSQSIKNLAKDEYESNFVSAVVPPEEVGVKFDDIGALEDVKRTLNELVTLPMRRPELFSHGNLLRPCKGILLFGPPGTGKTLLAKALATEAGANFINITGSALTSKWFGDAEKLTKALFSFASRLAPVIVFVDEVDSLLGARGGAFEHEATRRMRNEFMAAWDGLRSKDSQRILILGATNRPFDLDDAVIRRLPRRIYVDLPDGENRMKILKIFLSKENLDSMFKFDDLANATEGYSGSDLKNLCIAAAYRPVQELLEEEEKLGKKPGAPALRPLVLDDFIQAKSKVGASVAYDAASMNELRKWNEQYGEGGSRRRSPFGFGS